ncbi:RING-H2 finger protein ATL79-like [Curcuma longa]|uniref:RING-H2 finger protein ATL79-like n=1 Tax=Curcuma longa TaxID=136217 RepID=UPI003D9DB6A6
MAESHAGTGGVVHHPPAPEPAESSSNATANKWGPYSGVGDFGTNMAIVLASLFCTSLLAFSLGAAVRFLLRRLRRERQPLEKPEMMEAAAPALLFSAGDTRLAGAAAECAICLADFADGDAVRVLPGCGHGFHAQCVERWLVASRTCPTCRQVCGDEELTRAQKTA